MTLRARRIDDRAGFDDLRSAWEDMAAESGRASPFLSHDWFACCWGAVGPGHHPEVLVIEDAAGPRALLPLMRWRDSVHGLPVRRLGFLHCPDTPMTDLLTTLSPADTIEALLRHLRDRSDWDALDLQKVPGDSPILPALESALAGRLHGQRVGTLASPHLSVTDSWATFYGSRSPRFKKTCRNIQNRIERAGRVAVEEHRAVDPDGALIEEVIDLSRQSWKADRGVAIATMPQMAEFFRDLTRRASKRGWLSLWVLRLDGQALAMEYQLGDGHTVHALRADYHMAFRDLSPGSALSFAIARALFDRPNVREYCMGPGLNEYKTRWATGVSETVQLRAFRPSAYGHTFRILTTRVVPAARPLGRWIAARGAS